MIPKIFSVLCVLVLLCGSAVAFDAGVTGSDSVASVVGQGGDNDEDDAFDLELDFLDGDEKLACEAVLCLSSSTRPHECDPALKRYYSITARKWSNTVKKRRNFLKLCPSASADNSMISLTNSLAEGSGMCNIDTLNKRGNWVDKTERVSLRSSECRGSSSGTGKNGFRWSVSYSWHTDSEGWGGYCEKSVSYFDTYKTTPSECTNIWNHLYTDFEQRPHVVTGSNPWETHWTE